MTKPLPIVPNELEQVPMFAGLTATQMRMLSGLMQRKNFPSGATLLSQHGTEQHVYVLQSGTVKVCISRGFQETPLTFSAASSLAQRNGNNGHGATATAVVEPKAAEESEDDDSDEDRMVVLNLCGAGEVLGEMSSMDKLGHSADVVALEACRTLWLEGEQFRDCVAAMPGLANSLLQITQQRLRFATRQLYANATLEATGRLACQLLLFAERYGQETSEGGILIPLRLFQRDLADMIGSSRTRVNLAIAQLRAAGCLSQTKSGSLVIVNTDDLAAFCR